MKLSNVLIGLLCLVATSVASATTWTPETTNPFTITYQTGNKTKAASVTYTPGDATVYFGAGQGGSQNVDTIATLAETVFGLTPDSLITVGTVDSTGGTAGSFISDVGFNVMAVHFGGGELLFKWASNVYEFTISGLPQNLSNFRAYTDQPSTVPLPAAAWLFGSALFGFMGWSNRRKV